MNVSSGSLDHPALDSWDVEEGIPGNNTTLFMEKAQPHYKYVLYTFGCMAFICSITGNNLVIFILLKFHSVRRKSVSNYYILNLAFSDSAFTMALPFFTFSTYSENWVFGSSLCKILFILREINKFASIFTLVALSMDRYLASFHDLGYLRRIRIGKIICVSIWLSAFLMCLPYLLHAHSVRTSNGHSCKINWPSPVIHNKSMWIYSQLIFGLIIPFVLILLSYVMLIRRLKAIMVARARDRIRKPNRKMTQTVMAVIIVFITCQVS